MSEKSNFEVLLGLLINTLIIFGHTFIMVLSGLGIVTGEVQWSGALITALLTAGMKALTYLAHERGLLDRVTED